MDLRFGEHRLSRDTRQLHGPDGAISIGARSFDILLVLLENAGQVVGKNALMDAAWPGLAVEENTLQVHISALRKALGPAMIVTVHGRGYKYAGPDPVTARPPDPAAPPPLIAFGKDTTSVAVLPLANLSGDPEHDVFADGITEDLITELARYRHLSVIGHRLSSFYGDARPDLAAISRDLGVNFVILGSLRLAGNAVRVAVQLIDAQTGVQVWGDRFDRQITDIFAVQDQIVGAVIARLAINLDDAAEKQRQRDPTSSSSAYAQFLRARAAWRSGDAVQAYRSIQQAIALDPGYGRAQAYLGFFLAYDVFGQWFGLPEAQTVATARQAIDRAVAIDRTDPFVLQRAAMTHLMLGDPDAALRYAEAAAVESACDSEILVIRGLVIACCGAHDKGAAMLTRALDLERRLAPGCFSALAEVRHMQRDYAASMAALQMIPDPPHYVAVIQAANLARLGRMAEARRALASLPPAYDAALCARSEARLCAVPQDAAHWLESFRMAGIDV